MPKMKTNRGAAKRFKLTAKGHIKHRCANRSHILTKKGPKRKRKLRALGTVSGRDASMVKRMLCKEKVG
jgi:large subunit ribosomal protein L35